MARRACSSPRRLRTCLKRRAPSRRKRGRFSWRDWKHEREKGFTCGAGCQAARDPEGTPSTGATGRLPIGRRIPSCPTAQGTSSLGWARCTRRTFMNWNRREFVAAPAAIIATDLLAAEPAVPWQRKIRRLGQTNMTEHDPAVLDVEQWADYWASLKIDAVLVSVTGILAFYQTKV